MASKIQSILTDVLDHHRRQVTAEAPPLGSDRTETIATVSAATLALLVVCLIAVLMGMT